MESYQFSQKPGNGANNRGLVIGLGRSYYLRHENAIRTKINRRFLSNIKDKKNDINNKVINNNDNNNKTNNSKGVGRVV